jgi:hypothetical protein
MIDAAVRAAGTRTGGRPQVADDFGLLGDSKADSPEHGRVDPEDGHDEPAPAIRLLGGYSKALDFIASKPSILFVPHCSAHPESSGPCIIIPRVNRMAVLLAEAHVAARVDALLRRGRRFRALHPQGSSQLDLDRLQGFRDSLSPIRWRTLALWVILVALAIAFPVATIADFLRTLAPRAIVCSTESFAALIDNLSGDQSKPSCNVHHAGASLEKILLRIAHLNLNPGSVIDTVLSVRASGFIALLLLTVVMILSLCVVLLVFRSGFRLKRLAFSVPLGMTASQRERLDHESLIRSGFGSGGLYGLERDVFVAVGLRPPWEFPLDLAVSAGLLGLPLTIFGDLLILATTPGLDLRARLELTVLAAGLIVAVILRLCWLGRVWRTRARPKEMKSQEHTKEMEPPEQGIPNRATLRARSVVYLAVLLATVCAVWDIMLVGDPYEPVLAAIVAILFISPAVAWSLSMPWWYAIHREFKARRPGERTFRTPWLCVVPLFCAIAGMSMLIARVGFYLFNPFVQSMFFSWIAFTLLAIGILGSPVGIYRMAWKMKRSQCPAPHPALRANAAGLAATGMYVLSPAVVFYFQSSLNRILAEGATTAPARRAGADPPQHADQLAAANEPRLNAAASLATR